MLKKLLALAGCAALVLALAACGGEDASASSDRSVPDASVAGSASSADASQPDASAPDMSKSDISQTPDPQPDPSKPKLPVEKPKPALKEEKPKPAPKPDTPRGNLSDLHAPDGPAELAVTGILVTDPWTSGYVFLAQTNSGYSWEFLEPSTALEGQSGLSKGVDMTVVFDRATATPLASYPASAGFTIAQMEKTFKAGCASYSYSELVTNPDLHFGEPIKLTAVVTEVKGDMSRPDVQLTAAVGDAADPIVVEYNRHSAADPLPAVGETLNVYGFGQMLTVFVNAEGVMVDVPLIDAAYLANA